MNAYYRAFGGLAAAFSSSAWGGDSTPDLPREDAVWLVAEVERSLEALHEPTFVAPAEITADLDRTLAVTSGVLDALTGTDGDLDLEGWATTSISDADERAGERVFAYIETHCDPLGAGAGPTDLPSWSDGADAPSTQPPDRDVAVRLPDGRASRISVGAGGDTGGWVAAFVSESLTMLDPTGQEVAGALDHHGSGSIDTRASLFTPLAQLRSALPGWGIDLYDLDDDLVAEHLEVTDPETGDSWCIDVPRSAEQDFLHHAGACEVPPGLAPVGPPRRPAPDGP